MPSKRAKKSAGVAKHLLSSKDQPLGAAPADLPAIIEEIKLWHRQRVPAMNIRKIIDLKLGATLRMALGWSRLLPAAERKLLNDRAQSYIKICERLRDNERREQEKRRDGKPKKLKPVAIPDDPIFELWQHFINATLQTRSPMENIEERAVENMTRLAKRLPVWDAFGKTLKGFGEKSLATIIAETGDLSNYATVAKLWKRMGLAVMKGVRQGGLRKTASKEDWIRHGYNAKRRSVMFVVGDVLIKNKNDYYRYYLEVKRETAEKAKARGLIVAPAAQIPKNRSSEFMSLGHIHKHAQRLMEKRLLKNLWIAWRRAADPDFVESPYPLSSQDESPTTKTLKPKMRVSGESFPANAGGG